MTKFLIRRTIEMGITLVLASILLFAILNLAPGGPFDAIIARGHIQDPTYLDRLNKMIGLDKPIHERYLTWVGNVLQGSLGESWTIARGQPVNTIIGSRLPNTVMLMTTGLGFSLLIAIAIGTVSAVRQYSVFDNVFTAFSFFGISIPAFWFGLIMLKFFGLELKIFPVGGLYSVGKQDDLLRSVVASDFADDRDLAAVGGAVEPLLALESARDVASGLRPHGAGQRPD